MRMATAPKVSNEGYAQVLQLGYVLPIDEVDTVSFFEDVGRLLMDLVCDRSRKDVKRRPTFQGLLHRLSLSS